MLSGRVLGQTRLGDRWIHASYDYLFLFGAREVTNPPVLIMMDNDAYHDMHQVRDQAWDRSLHAKLLNRLADDGCALTVFDVFFEEQREPASTDEALAAAMRRQKKIVLAARQSESALGKPIESVSPIPPEELFVTAAQTNWGVACVDPIGDKIVRLHWPFPDDASFESLPAVAARVAGARWSSDGLERWLRYYGERGAWTALSYHHALEADTNFFRDKIVFIGSKPADPYPDARDEDKFRTPYTRWRQRSVGGVEILATAFLNLVNNDWLRRTSAWIEIPVWFVAGGLLLLVFHRVRPLTALGIGAASAVGVVFAGVSLSYVTNYWFPYLVIAGGQIPCAFIWRSVRFLVDLRSKPTIVIRSPDLPNVPAPGANVPDYEIIEPAFGKGAYGKVWLARNAIGQWQAFKSIYLAKFNNNSDPYEREFNGIKRYKPVSDKHPGLLRVDFVSRRKSEGYFYYVMELADSRTPGWEENPSLYKPRDLSSLRNEAPGKRLPVKDCAFIGAALADALDFLHRQKLTHRDIKPSNILFVNGRPKLGDVGLVAELKEPSPENTWVGTVGFMPPAPEPPGTAQADIYGLGMVLYVISTGREPALFPELSATLVEGTEHAQFLGWNQILLKACNPDCAQRYRSAAELHSDLLKLLAVIETGEVEAGAA